MEPRKTSVNSDLATNSPQAFSQFQIKRVEAKSGDTPASVVERKRPSAEDIAKDWEQLGVQRCQNCKFTTDDEKLFKQHSTTCTISRSTGTITLSYANGEFKCNACNEPAWTNKSEFEEHIVCHIQDHPYICLTCLSKSFSSRQEIEIHTKKEHPKGDSKCGLRGMKKGRKFSEELIKSGSLNILGKLSIPKTPRNLLKIVTETDSMSPTSSVVSTSVVASTSNSDSVQQVNPMLSKTSSGTVYHRPTVDLSSPPQGSSIHSNNRGVAISSAAAVLPVSTTTVTANPRSQASATQEKKVTSNQDPQINIEGEINRPMPPARTCTITLALPDPNMGIYTSKGGTLVRISPGDQAKSLHLSTLFKEFNTTTNSLQPTTVSQRIHEIANPSAITPVLQAVSQTSTLGLVTKPTQYHVKSITQYTSTPTVRTVTSAVSSIAPQSVILLPVGQPILQPSGHYTNTGILLNLQPGPNTGQNITSLASQSSRLITPNSQQIRVVNQISQTAMNVSTVISDSKNIPITNVQPPGKLFLSTTMPQMPQLQPAPGIQVKPPPPYCGAVRSLQTHSTPVIQQFIQPPTPASQPHIQPVAPNALEREIKDNETIPKKFLFRIKPGQGFVCEVCKKFTKDEYIFRRHVWEHFHGFPLACKSCSSEEIIRKDILLCKLVNNIVCNLIKRSSSEVQEISSQQLKVLKVGESEVIDITDEDDKNENTTEVIVLDDDDENGDGTGLQIKISSAFSLSGETELEQMTKRVDDSVHPNEDSVIGPNKSATAVDKQSEIDKNLSLPESNSDKACTGKSSAEFVTTEQSQTSDSSANPNNSNENDEDGKLIGKELLEKSLSEPNKESDDLVSQVLDSNLKNFDPIKSTIEEICREEGELSSNKTEENVNAKNDSDTQSCKISKEPADKDIQSANKVAFDSFVLSKQSHNAFYCCGYETCTFTCMSSSKYREHLKDKIHEKEYNFICGHCGQKDYTEDSHVRHIFGHANSKTFLLFRCPIRLCKYKTNLINLYGEHLKAHPSEELTVKCNYCNKIFPTIESLELHLKQNLLKFVVCPHCSFKFMDRFIVMQHIKLFHPDKPRMVLVTSQIVCNEREISFYVPPKSKNIQQEYVSEKDLRDAENLDIPSLLDNFQKENTSKENQDIVETRMEVESENEDNADAVSLPEEDQSELNQGKKDSESDKALEQKDGPSIKIRIAKKTLDKGGNKSLECSKCSYLSYNTSLHAKHMSLHDMDPEREKKYVCNLCPKGSNDISQFKKHVMNHIGKHELKIFQCTSCSFSSNLKCNIMDHVRDAHSAETLYTLKVEHIESNHFECKYCSYKARTAEQVASHETSEHKFISSTDNDRDASETKKKRRKYHCDYCNEFFKHKASLKEHLTKNHLDINNKQFIFFKCKYCAYTSTMKDKIISHIEKEHPGKELRILRKIEPVSSEKTEGNVDSGKQNDESEITQTDMETSTKNTTVDANEDIIIPDGNVFKNPFRCPKCPFTSNMRIKTMIHLKEHPELKPVRPNQDSQSTRKTARKSSTAISDTQQRKTARKSTSIATKDKRTGSLIQDIPDSSLPFQNPFTLVKKLASDNTESPVSSLTIDSPSKEHFILGEEKLHIALSACFIPSEKDLNFQCKICKQRIFKKFVLHRHVLDHLKIVFFKCKYCEEGSIERTLMVGHIQKDHPSKPVLYSSVNKSDLEMQLKEKINKQDFSGNADLPITADNLSSPMKGVNIFKKAVHEYQIIDDDSNGETEKPATNEEENKNKFGSLKCPKCRYVARLKHYLSSHLESHNDPAKKFTCSVCDFRGDKVAVIKHVYRVFHLKPATVLENGEPVYNKKTMTSTSSEKKRCSIENSEQTPKDCKIINENDQKFVTSSQGKQIKVESLKISGNAVYEIRTLYKCKECGEKRESKSGIYHHFKNSGCNKPVFKCSACSFQNTAKDAIYIHAEKRHPNKTISILDLPIAAKFRLVKIPIKHDQDIIKGLANQGSFDSERNVSAKSPETSIGSFQSEENSTDSQEIKQIRCQLCTSYKCQSPMILQFHINTSHRGATLFCLKCSYKTPLVKHMINHCKHLHLQKVALYGSKPFHEQNIPLEESKREEKESSVDSDENIVISCPKCDVVISQLSNVLKHLKTHFSYKPYFCSYCEKGFASEFQIKKHSDSVHVGKTAKYKLIKNLSIETKVQKMYDQIKKKISKRKIMLGKTRPASLNRLPFVEDGIRKSGKVFHCDFCQYKSERRCYVRRHLHNIHPGLSKKRPLEVDSDTESPKKKIIKLELEPVANAKPNIASDSDEVSDSSEESKRDGALLKYKVVKINNWRKLQCLLCKNLYSSFQSLKQHHHQRHANDKDRVNTCFYCTYSSQNKSLIYKHCESQHPLLPAKMIDKHGNVASRDTASNAEKLMTSPARSSSSSSSRSPAESASSDHSKSRKSDVTHYCCNLCKYSVSGLLHFREHLVVHKEFTQLTTEFDEESKRTCGFCSFIGKNNFELATHIPTHMNEPRYKCAYCDHNQFSPTKISIHLRNMHPDRKEVVIDRELRKAHHGRMELVNLDPVLQITPMSKSTSKRKFRRIMIETDDSSDSSSDEMDGKKNKTVKTTSSIDKIVSGTVNTRKNLMSNAATAGNTENILANEISKPMEYSRVSLGFEAELKSDVEMDENDTYEELNSMQITGEIEPFTDKYSEDNGSQAFMVETQPFSPSDLLDKNDKEENEIDVQTLDGANRTEQKQVLNVAAADLNLGNNYDADEDERLQDEKSKLQQSDKKNSLEKSYDPSCNAARGIEWMETSTSSNGQEETGKKQICNEETKLMSNLIDNANISADSSCVETGDAIDLEHTERNSTSQSRDKILKEDHKENGQIKLQSYLKVNGNVGKCEARDEIDIESKTGFENEPGYRGKRSCEDKKKKTDCCVSSKPGDGSVEISQTNESNSNLDLSELHSVCNEEGVDKDTSVYTKETKVTENTEKRITEDFENDPGKSISSFSTVNITEKGDSTNFAVEKERLVNDNVSLTSDTLTNLKNVSDKHVIEKLNEDSYDSQHNEKTTETNVFETFLPELRLKEGVSKECAVMEEKDNIFEKFSINSNNTVELANDLSSVEMNVDCSSSKNKKVLENNSNLESVNNSIIGREVNKVEHKLLQSQCDVEAKKPDAETETESYNEKNIFEKFSVTQSDLDDPVEDKNNRIDDYDKNIFEHFANASETVDNDEHSNIEADSGKSSDEQSLNNKDTCSSNENQFEDMEVDELINSIEETINEGRVNESMSE